MIPSHFALGLDISKYDIRYNAEKRHVDFIIQRVSYGLKRDERFEVLWGDIRPVEIRGAYHYYNTGAPWRAQAELFLSLVAGRGYHFLALDYETYYNNLNASSADDARRILKLLYAEAAKPVLLYANPNVYENYLMPYGDWMAEWPLWISQWNSKWWHENRATGPRLPKGRTTWTIWQYGGDYQHPSGLWSVPGYAEGPDWGVQSKHVDLDVFNGNVEDMRVWVDLDAGAEDEQAPRTQSEHRQARLDELANVERYIDKRKLELIS